MGTNFYINNSQRQHIGKRLAAGLYCWDCHDAINKALAKADGG